MIGRVSRSLWVLGSTALSCAGQVPQTAPAEAARKSADLRGLWVEYWAPAGAANTQRYVFLEDGRFAWVAPAGAPAQRATRKAGRYQLQSRGPGSALTLQVGAEEFAACAEPCGHAQEGPRRVEHPAPLVETYELGDCAPNQEAQAVDASYSCLSIGGRAFWRRPLPAANDTSFLWTDP